MSYSYPMKDPVYGYCPFLDETHSVTAEYLVFPELQNQVKCTGIKCSMDPQM